MCVCVCVVVEEIDDGILGFYAKSLVNFIILQKVIEKIGENIIRMGHFFSKIM